MYLKRGYGCTLRQLKNFYIRYWIVFITFIPIEIMFGKYKFNLTEFILNLIDFVSPYNSEWWNIKCYCIFMLILPILYLIDCSLNKKTHLFAILLIYIMLFFISALFYNKVLVIFIFYSYRLWCLSSHMRNVYSYE